MTSVSDIVDHAMISLIAVSPIAIPAVIAAVKVTSNSRATKERVEEVHEQMPTTDALEAFGEDIRSRINGIDNRFTDHITNSEAAWSEQQDEMTHIAQLLGRHMRDGHTHTVAGKQTSPAKMPASRSTDEPESRPQPSQPAKKVTEAGIARSGRVQGLGRGRVTELATPPPRTPPKKR